jgi:PTH1 family peptidyl-tRNA hydrolase
MPNVPRLVVGLGNPGRKYEGHRHNVGFVTVDELMRAEGLPAWREKFSGTMTKGPALGTEIVLLKPATFMNLSGQSVQPAAAFLKVSPPDIVVVHDELDLPFGDVRVKVGGGHAGHNGLRSLIEHLGADFVRVRIGIGRPPPGFRGEVADYVLSDFDPLERAELDGIVARAIDATRRVLLHGAEAAMNAVNQKPKKPGGT